MALSKIYLQHDLNLELNCPVPAGFYTRLYKNQTDTEKWANILVETGEFANKQDALTRFNEEFLPHLHQVKERMIFLDTTEGRTIGTATAWYGMNHERVLGRLHWVEIIPEFQSKGLGRPLIAEAMRILKSMHQEAYLTTQARSMVAIHLYLDLGWTPFIETAAQKKAWDLLSIRRRSHNG